MGSRGGATHGVSDTLVGVAASDTVGEVGQ